MTKTKTTEEIKEETEEVEEEVVESPVLESVETEKLEPEKPIEAPIPTVPPIETPAEKPADPDQETAKPDIKKILTLVLVGVGILIFVGGGIFTYRQAMVKKDAQEVVVKGVSNEIPVPTEIPEATPVPELDLADLKIQVLNGRGVPGTAGEAQELLEGLGYEDITVGNADSFDYEETEISIKADKEDYLEGLLDGLSEEYSLAEETTTLDEESEFDVVIIVGKE